MDTKVNPCSADADLIAVMVINGPVTSNGVSAVVSPSWVVTKAPLTVEFGAPVAVAASGVVVGAWGLS